MIHLPFSISKRKGHRFFYVQFKEEDVNYFPAISTKQTIEAVAIETAFKWLRELKRRGLLKNYVLTESKSIGNPPALPGDSKGLTFAGV